MSVELSRVEKRKLDSTPTRRQKNSKLKKVMKAFFIALISLGVISVGFYFGSNMLVSYMLGDDSPTVIAGNGVEEESAGSLNKEGPVNVLIIGTDQRKNEPTRSDTLILATLYPQDKEAKLLSIPRDTKVKIRGHGTTKMGHAFAYGGKKLAVETVEDLLGVPIDYSMETNFVGFKNIIDILGGVTLNVERRMYKPLEDIDLRPGVQTLNGYDSLAYVRWRGDGTGDIGRIQRQEKFLGVLANEAASISTVWKLPDLIGEVRDHIRTDLASNEILYLATKYATMNSDNMESNYVPGEPIYENGISYWEVDYFELEEIIDRMQTKPSDLLLEEAENEAEDGNQNPNQNQNGNQDRDGDIDGSQNQNHNLDNRENKRERNYNDIRLRAASGNVKKEIAASWNLAFLRR